MWHFFLIRNIGCKVTITNVVVMQKFGVCLVPLSLHIEAPYIPYCVSVNSQVASQIYMCVCVCPQI
jgi:hypothetical protein